MKKKQKTASDAATHQASDDFQKNQTETSDNTFELSDSMRLSDDPDNHPIENEVDETFNILDDTTVIDDTPLPEVSASVSSTVSGKKPFDGHITMVPGGDLDAVLPFEPAAPKPTADRNILKAAGDNLEKNGKSLPDNSRPSPPEQETAVILNENEQVSHSSNNIYEETIIMDKAPTENISEPIKNNKSKQFSEESEKKNEDLLDLNSEMMIQADETADSNAADDDILDLTASVVVTEEPGSTDAPEKDKEDDDFVDLNASTVMMTESVLKAGRADQSDSGEDDDDILDLTASAVVTEEPDSPGTPETDKEDDDFVDLNAPTVMMAESVLDAGRTVQTDPAEEDDDDILDLTASAVVTEEPDSPDTPETDKEDDDFVDLNAPTVMMTESVLDAGRADQTDPAEEEDDDILDLTASTAVTEDQESSVTPELDENDVDLSAPTFMMEGSDFESNPPDQSDPGGDNDGIFDLNPSSVVAEEPESSVIPETEKVDGGDADLYAPTVMMTESDIQSVQPDQPDSGEDDDDDILDLTASAVMKEPESSLSPEADEDDDDILDLGAVDAEVISPPSSSLKSESDGDIQTESESQYEETIVQTPDIESLPEADVLDDEDDASADGRAVIAPMSDSIVDMEFKLPDDFPMPIFDEPPEFDGGGEEQEADDELTMTGILDTLDMPVKDISDGEETDTLLDMSILDSDNGMFSSGDAVSLTDPPDKTTVQDDKDAPASSDDNKKKMLKETASSSDSSSETAPLPAETDLEAASTGAVSDLDNDERDADRTETALSKPKQRSSFRQNGIPIIEILPEGGEADLPHAKTCHSSFTQSQIEKALERVIEKIFSEKIEGILQDAVEKAVTEEVKRLTNFMMIDDAEDI